MTCYRLNHGFTCAGMLPFTVLPLQPVFWYRSGRELVCSGRLTVQSYLESIIMFSVCEVYRDGGYIQVDEDCARERMAKARRR